MGILSGLLGNASEIDVNELEKELQPILITNEQPEKAFKLVRDLFVFTDKRLILIDKQGITGKKIEYHSIPYHDISHFSIELAGHFDLDAELKIWLRGNENPITKEFKKDSNIHDVQRTLASYVLRT